jgi:hypothetical protein
MNRALLRNWFQFTENRHAASIPLRARDNTASTLENTVIPSAEKFVRLCNAEGLQQEYLYTAMERLALSYVLLGDEHMFRFWNARAARQLPVTKAGFSRRARWKNNVTQEQWEAAFQDPRAHFNRWGELSR